jgi:hypothetical protein
MLDEGMGMKLCLTFLKPTLTIFLSAGVAGAAVDLSGFWERRDTAGSGAWENIDAKIPKAALLRPADTSGGGPGGAPQSADTAPHAAGQPYIVTNGRCGTMGLPGTMAHSAALDIVQGKAETLIVGEMPGAQHIFTGGRQHPAARLIEPSPTGHSIGHWDGDTFVVDTVGLTAGGGIPGGGQKSPETHLTERFRLLDGGKRMTVTFTWDDPKIYARPHTYEYTYYKDPDGSYAFEEWCDSGDPLQKQSIVPRE